MLDKLSKKILKYMRTESDGKSRTYNFDDDLKKMAEALSSDTEVVRAAIRYLEQNGYIKFMKVNSGYVVGFYLDHKGLHQTELSWRAFGQYVADKWIDFLALGVSAVSLIVAIAAYLRTL